MNKQSVNKILPSIVSIMIIAGMAIQSFATNIDMAAFVQKDKYMTKYYELDWRIKEVDKNLEKLYKFTCTNIRSFGGSGKEVHVDNAFYQLNSGQTYHWYSYPIADLSQEGYLRFNCADAINFFGNHSKIDNMEYEIPANLLKWRNDIELYPNTKVKFLVTRSWPNTNSITQTAAYKSEIIMGPFKKFPYMNVTGVEKAFCSTNGYILPIASVIFTTVQYAYGRDTEPTSWTSMTGNVNVTSGDINTSTAFPTELKTGIMTKEQIEQAYTVDRVKLRTSQGYMYPNTAFSVDTSQYDKVWIKFFFSYTNMVGYYGGPDQYTITTWNYNK